MGRDKLHHLLQVHNLILRRKRTAPKTTNSAHDLRKYPNLLLDTVLTIPQQAWVCDITYVCIGLGFGQYCSFVYIQRPRQAEIAISMTQHGDPYENTVAERINGILKTDFRLNRVFTTFEGAARAVEQSVCNYDHLRPHISCGHLTPAAAHTSTEPLQKHWKPKNYKTASAPVPADTT